MDVAESAQELRIALDLPGFELDDLDVRIEGQTLVLAGERRREHESDGRIVRRERRFGRFQRLWRRPAEGKREALARASPTVSSPPPPHGRAGARAHDPDRAGPGRIAQAGEPPESGSRAPTDDGAPSGRGRLARAGAGRTPSRPPTAAAAVGGA
jgi:hypothetical protein